MFGSKFGSWVPRGVIVIVRSVVVFAIILEIANIIYSVVQLFRAGIQNISPAVYSVTEGGLFLLALSEIYVSLGYVIDQSTKSLVFIMEAGLAYTVREIIFEFHSGNADFITLGSISLIVLSLGVTLYLSSRSNRIT
ncbi:MAG: phosphate-starvation-inducible PsiE family protein [Thermoplasmataceae archaeon]